MININALNNVNNDKFLFFLQRRTAHGLVPLGLLGKVVIWQKAVVGMVSAFGKEIIAYVEDKMYRRMKRFVVLLQHKYRAATFCAMVCIFWPILRQCFISNPLEKVINAFEFLTPKFLLLASKFLQMAQPSSLWKSSQL